MAASEMGARVRHFDWAATPLGPIERWPRSLRIAVGICLNSRFPMFVWWGRELVNVYNDAYIPMLGSRHPDALGKPAPEIWREIWDIVGAQARAVMERGEATYNERAQLTLQRHGYPEETWFTWSYSPIFDEDGRIGGLFCAVTEETARVVAERDRVRLLAQIEGERARLAEAFERAPSFFAILRGPEHVFEYANERYADLIGTREIIGRPLRDAIPEVQGQGFLEILDRVYQTGEPYVGKGATIRIRRSPGAPLEDLFVDFVYQPVRGHDGRIVGIIAHGVDVTARTQIADALASEKKILEMIATGSPLPTVLERIVLWIERQSASGMRGSILLVDEAGTHLRHCAAPNLPNEYNQALDGLAIGPDAGSCAAAASERRVVVVEDVQSDPSWAPFSELAARYGLRACTATPIMGADGRVLGTVAAYYAEPGSPSARDHELIRSATHLAGIVLEKHRVDQRLRQSLEAEQHARGEAERASRMKDEFLATLSHELRTPLNAIMGWAHMLRRPEATPREIQRGAEVIERNARAQSTIIEDLLDMSAILSGKVRLQMQPLEVATMVRTSIDTARPTAEAKRIAIEHDLKDLDGTRVSGDPNRLQQILWNLLSNAIKFTPREGRIRVEAQGVDGRVQVAVSDTGEGIPASFLPYLFDRFRQADPSSTRRHGGLGLGLSIVKHLVELHGGSVRAHSDGEGRGSTFTVTLPMAGAAPGAVDLRHVERRAGASGAVLHDDAQLIAGKRVLVVDDDADARDLAQRLLEDCGARVTTAGSSNEALGLLRAQTFDALVSDIGMPGEDGHALMRQVRSLSPNENADIPAMALTAYARPEDRVKAIRAGFQMHAAKPVDPPELVAMVAGLVRQRAAAA
ncbi:MAG: ATP-binding protein [Betaproteobacteria bacterium]